MIERNVSVCVVWVEMMDVEDWVEVVGQGGCLVEMDEIRSLKEILVA